MAEQRITLVGAGSVGSLLAGAMLYAGQGFTWVVRNPKRRAELDELVLQLPKGGRALSMGDVRVVDSLDRVGATDLALVAVKAHQLDSVLPGLNLDSDNTLVIANGLQHGPFCLGLLSGGAFLKHGVVVTGMENELTVGGLCLGQVRGCQVFCDLLQAPFLHVSEVENVKEKMWLKLAVNCVVNPMTAMLDCDNGDLLGRLHGPLVQGMLGELEQVMIAESVGRFNAPTKMGLLKEVKSVLQATRNNSSSLREDILAGRPTEIGSLNFAVVEVGKQHGIECPINQEVGRMILLLSGRGPL